MESVLAVGRTGRLPMSRAGARSAATGETRALFERLFAEYHTPIINYLYRLVGDAAQAEELAQETFTRAWQASHSLPGLDNPRAWLYRIATNAARDHHRRARLIAWLPLRGGRETPALEGPEAEGDPLERDRMRRALLHLPSDYRTPLVLYVCEEFSVADIAATLNLSRDAVKQRLVRARERLRNLMGPEAGPSELDR